ncbi:MAG TPA: hypothetical protein VNS50_03070 [Ginsengibacter sp.]|nr:hypothetical protein [Ginsengibacter sp.]
MRFLLSLILSSFLFIAPFQGNAGEVRGKQLTAGIKSTSTTNLLDYSISDGYADAIINSNHRNSLTTQYRFFSFTNFINLEGSQSRADFFYEGKLFVQPHLYCKRIGLKLVFPEHYFW